MQDFFSVLFFAVIIIVSIISSVNKEREKKKSRGNSHPASFPQEVTDTLPESWKDLFPVQPVIVKPVVEPVSKKTEPKRPDPKPFLDTKEEGKQTIFEKADQKIIADEESVQQSDYSFQSLEDIRKAIVWSEIINRKY